MLIQFTAENCLSLKEKVTLSLLASRDNEHEEHLITVGEKDKYLKSAVIYGANASGKSNILNAFWFMVDYVLTSHEKQLNRLTDRVPFKFDRQSPSKPSAFEVIFVAGGVRYAYGFSATDREITEEYLYRYPNGRKAIVFERTNTSNYRFTNDAELQNSLKDRNSHNKLYLSTAANWNYEAVKPVFEWFASCSIICKHSSAEAYGLNAAALQDDEYRDAIAAMLQVADFGIKALDYRDSDSLNRSAIARRLSGDCGNIDTVHQVRDEEGNLVPYVLNMTEESDGTNSYFKLAGVVKATLEQGGILVADEMDVRLHPLLTRLIVSLFNSEEHNPNGAQLVFTSHNTNLLDLDIFRRDQIWFTEKDEQTGETELFSLYDFSVRKDTKVEKSYLIGRFGAVPFIKGGARVNS